MDSERYDRSVRLFGEEGQRRIRRTSVAIYGVGGLGSAVAQQLALLGFRRIYLIDGDRLEITNRNRLIGARDSDPDGSLKIGLVQRLVTETNGQVDCVAVPGWLVSDAAFLAGRDTDWIVGCLDGDGPRAILNELAAAYSKPYVDLATDVVEPGVYGGRVCSVLDGQGCLLCLDLLDPADVRRYLASEHDRAQEKAIYGVDRGALHGAGPSVVTINAVVAGLGVTELMAAVTGMRAAHRLLTYRGHQGKVSVSAASGRDCPVCRGIRGLGASADVERYLRLDHLVHAHDKPI